MLANVVIRGESTFAQRILQEDTLFGSEHVSEDRLRQMFRGYRRRTQIHGHRAIPVFASASIR